MKIFQPIVSGSFTTSGSVFLKGLTSAAQSNVVIIDTATGQLYTTASSALGGGGGGGTGAGFPYTGSALITGSLTVTGSVNVSQGITGSLEGPASWANKAQEVNISDNTSYGGSTFYPVFSVNTSGTTALNVDSQIFTYNPSTNILTTTSSQAISSSYALTASFALNGGGGAAFPFSGSAVITGSLIVTSTIQLDGSLTDYTTVNSTIVGTNNLYTKATGSYTSAFVKYTVSSGVNSRAGEFITNWNGTTVTYFDNSTTDIGSTSDIVFSSAIVSSEIQVNATVAASGWKIKTLATFI